MLRWTFPILLVLIAAGCSDDGNRLVPVEGTVLMDGKPLDNVTIHFIPEAEGNGAPAAGPVGKNGHFHLMTNTLIGAAPGRYKVTVSKIEFIAATEEGRGALKAKELLPATFAEAAKTPLRQEVPPGGKKDILIQLNPNPDPPPTPKSVAK